MSCEENILAVVVGDNEPKIWGGKNGGGGKERFGEEQVQGIYRTRQEHHYTRAHKHLKPVSPQAFLLNSIVPVFI